MTLNNLPLELASTSVAEIFPEPPFDESTGLPRLKQAVGPEIAPAMLSQDFDQALAALTLTDPWEPDLLSALSLSTPLIETQSIIAADAEKSSQILIDDVLTSGGLLSGERLLVPGDPSETVTLTFNWTEREAVYNNELGLFKVNALGEVDGVAPGDSDYATTALSSANRQTIFKSGQNVGAFQTLTVQGGDQLAFYLVPDQTTDVWLSQNAGQPAQSLSPVFFSLTEANIDGFDHLITQQLPNDTWQFAWEDLLGGGDRDFDDAVFTVFEGPGILEKTPGTSGQLISTRFDWTAREAAYKNELGLFLVDDREGRIGGLLPQDEGYALAALSEGRRQVVFESGQTTGATNELNLPGDTYFGWYLIQNSSTQHFLQLNPGNQIGKGPLAFFSLSDANPDNLFHITQRPDGNYAWEDLTGGGDRDFDDLVYQYAFAEAPVAAGAPKIQASLLNDTGTSNTDRLTSDATIQGIITSSNAITTLKAGFGDVPVADFVDITDALQGNAFQLDQAKLAFINGGILPDEEYKLRLLAVDDQANRSEVFDYNFALDTTIQAPALTLATAYDSGTVGDLKTSFAKVVLEGTTDADTLVELQGTDTATVSDRTNRFALRNVALADGDNSFTAIATDAAGNQASGAITIQKTEPDPVRNNAPVITSTPSPSFSQGSSSYQYQLEATDTDNDPLTYSLVNGPQGAVMDAAGLLQWSPGENPEADFTVQVADGQGGVATQRFEVSGEDTTLTGGTIAGEVWQDSDGNGQRDDLNEPGFAGVSVYLDLNDNEQLDAAEPVQTTAADNPNTADVDETGRYSFTELAPGQYSVRQVVPTGYTETSPGPAGRPALTITESERFAALDFGNKLDTGTADNRAPVFISDPLENFSIPLPGSASGDVNPEFLNLSLGENETFFGSVSITLPVGDGNGSSADIVFVVDESGSMAGEHEWLTEMVLQLNASLEARGITDNRFSLLGFGGNRNDARVRSLTLPAQPDIEIYGPGNQLIDTQSPNPSPTDFSLPASGDYTVVLSTETDTPLDYDLQVSVEDATAVTPQGFNQTLERTIEAGDQQTYTFEAPAGLKVWFDSISATSSIINGKLFSPSGEVVGESVRDSDSGPFSLPVSGTYTWVMDGGSEGGTYSFQLLDLSNAPTLPLDTPMSGTIDSQTTQPFKIQGTIGQRLFIDVIEGAVSSFSLYGPNNNRISTFQSSGTGAILPGDGTYWLVLENRAVAPSDYRIEVVTPNTPVVDVALNSIVSSSLTEAGEVDIYQFEGKTGQGIWFDGITTEFFLVELYAPDGDLVFATRTTADSGIATLPSDGTYSLRIGGSDDVGDYSFQILDTGAATNLPIGTAISDSVNPGRSTQVYTIEATAGQRLQFNSSGVENTLAGRWQLFSPANAELQSNRLTEDFEAVITDDGTYQLIVSGLQDNPVNYGIQVNNVSTAAIATTGMGVINSDAIAAAEEIAYTFTAPAGARILLDTLGASDRGIEAELTAPNGDSVARKTRLNSNDPEPYVLADSGTYTLTVTGGNNGGDYSFRLLDFEDAIPLSIDATTEVTLPLGLETQLYEFDGTSGTRLRFDIDQSIAASGFLRLFYPGGGSNSVVTQSFIGDLDAVLPGDGKYVLALQRTRQTADDSLKFQVLTPETQIQAISVGETIAGSIDESGEIDRYTFAGGKGQKLWIEALGAPSTSIRARLISPTGSQLFGGGRQLTSPNSIQITPGDQQLRDDRNIGLVTLPEDGTYALQVTGLGTVGTYGFRVSDLDSFAALPIDNNFSGQIESASTEQIFQLKDGVAGQTLEFASSEPLFSDISKLSADLSLLSTTRGGVEDGYAGLDEALNLPFRGDAATNLILITDEARSIVETPLTFDSIFNRIVGQDTQLTTVLNAQFDDENGASALGLNAEGTVYLADSEGGFTLSSGGTFTGSGFVPFGDTATIKQDYVDLALALEDGSVWDLNQLRAGGNNAAAFTQAFVASQSQELSEQFSVDIAATDPAITFNNTTGQLAGIGAGEAADFDIEITGDGTAQSFELLFTRPESGVVLGSVPVVVNQSYVYPALATDPDGDALTYSLTTAPDGATIDVATGAITWNPPAVGDYAFSIQADDGRGGTAVQEFVVVVKAINAGNEAPIIMSTPAITSIDADQAFTYDVEATDADGDPLSYYLTEAPAGLQIDRETGVISWTPTNEQAGPNIVAVQVLDGKGKSATQQFEVLVNATLPNGAPFFASSPVTTALTGSDYQYQPLAIDPEGETLTYSLLQQPDGMEIDPTTGSITWLSDLIQVGDYSVVIAVSDSAGNTTQQIFQLIANDGSIADTLSPELALTFSNTIVAPGESVTLQVSATDNRDLASLTVTLNGTPVALSPSSTINGQRYTAAVQLETSGLYTVEATAVDGTGNTSVETFDLRAADPSDVTPPDIVLDLSDLEVGKPLSSAYEVSGAVADDNLAFYQVEYAPTRLVDLGNPAEVDADYMVVSQGSANADGVLGTLDPRFLDNDEYFVRVVAEDFSGNRSAEGFVVGVATENKVGNFTLDATDLNLPLTGIPITVQRRYDTLQANSSESFGYGWAFAGLDARISESALVTDGPGSADFFTGTAFKAGDRVTLTAPSGKRVGFTFTPEPVQAGFFGTVFQPKFTADPGVEETLAVDSTNLSQKADGSFGLYLFGFAYNPSEYKLTTKENLTYTYNQFTGLQTVSDLNGNALTYSDSGIVSSTGEAVRFERDSEDRITRIVDPSGNSIGYQYDNEGDLVAVTDRAGNTTRYEYDPDRPHYLTEEIDPLGRSSVRTEFDDQGRIERIIDAEGNALEIDINFDGPVETQTITDPLNFTTTLVYDDRGNVLQQIDPEGGVTKYEYNNDNRIERLTNARGFTTSFSYDNRGNLLTETDALDRTTTFTYNALNQVETITDADGLASINRYDELGNLQQREDAEGNITEYSYFADGTLKTVSDAEDNITEYVYDNAGRVEELQDATGAVTGFDYDNSGNIKTITTPLNHTTTFGYDGTGRLVRVVDARGNETNIQYNAVGERSAVIDALGRRTGYTYNQRGLLERTQYADGTAETILYDATDRQIGTIDRAGGITRFIYDGLSRLVSTVYPDATPADDTDNARTRREYDATGNLAAFVDENGNRTEYEYDEAGQQVLIRDALDNETEYEYDPVGNLIVLTDALNRQTKYDYDNVGQLVKTTFADNTFTQTLYDKIGRVATEIDQNGIETSFGYDELDRLIEVEDALENKTTYGYDDEGNLIRQTDALGRTTTYSYDELNQRTKIELPLGQTETYTYDAVGNLKSVIDFNDQTIFYDYNINDLLATERFEDGSSVAYTYTPNQLLETVEDFRGTTQYQYDERDRLTTQTNPDNTFLNYDYDAVGNRTSLITPSGEVTYTFDPLNRIKTVNNRNDRKTTYSYDVVGNLLQTELPNGVVETGNYNAVNNLIQLQQQNAVGLIASYQYTLDKTGRRQRVDELNGRVAEYAYDDLYRLTEENITDPVNGNRTVGYTYDGVGNRQTRVDSIEDAMTYQYDGNNRLLSYTLNGEIVAYTYDDNGNTRTKTDSQGITIYTWDQQNRLIQVNTPNGDVIAYQYDPDGNRIAEIINGVETRFLVDSEETYAQIVEEYQPNGAIDAEYTFGNALISQEQEGEETFQHGDAQNSVQVITDEAGNATGELTYDAFGRVINQTGETDITHQYTGEQFDETTGLTYLRARYYDADAGRFLSKDAFEGFLSSPLTQNGYSYVENDPPFKTDPSGNTAVDKGVLAGILVPSARVLSGARRLTQANFATQAATRATINLLRYASKQVLADQINLGFAQIIEVLQEGLISPSRPEDPTDPEKPTEPQEPEDPDEPKEPSDDTNDPEDPNDGKGNGPKSNKPPSQSDFWKKLRPYKNGLKTNGKSGKKKELYDWDYTHNDIEVYNGRGQHKGSIDPSNGKLYKQPVPGRTIQP